VIAILNKRKDGIASPMGLIGILKSQLPMVLILAIPWLNPFAIGPSSGVMPWLVSLGSFAALIALTSIALRVKNQSISGPQGWACIAGWSWLLAGLISSIAGILQYAGASAIFEPWINKAPWGEAFANLRQRNQFASLTNIGMAALIWISSQSAGKGHAWLSCACAALLAVGNAASASRTGLFQLFVLCMLPLIWQSWRSKRIYAVIAAAVVTYAGATVIVPFWLGFSPNEHGIFARLQNGDQQCASRLVLWSNVLQLIRLKPWSGWGWGELDYAHYITLYNSSRFCDILDNAHNLPLHLTVELGLPAALLICGGFLCWVVRRRPLAETDPARQLAWSVMALILLHSMLEYPLWYGPFQIAFCLCVVLLWQKPDHLAAVAPKQKNWDVSPNSALGQMCRLTIFCFLMTIIFIAASAYHRASQIYLAPAQRDAAYREDTLNKIRGTWFFGDLVSFAELATTPLTKDKAEWTYSTAKKLLHYSPEPRVIEKLVESAVMLGRDDEAVFYLARYRAAFPEEHARWAKAHPRQGRSNAVQW
jgi:O-antigen ligase